MSATGTPEGDHLLAMIRQLVHGRVPPEHEELVVEIVARTTVVIFSDPQFYSHLRLVQDLQSRIIQLERVISLYQQGQVQARPVKVAKKVYKAPAKKAAKKLPTQPKPRASKKAPASLNVRQFRKGTQGH